MTTQSRAQDAAPFFDAGRLTLARHLAGIRKNELAQRVGKSASTITAWESGAKRPTAPNLAQLALGLQVDPEFFVAREDLVGRALPHFRSLRSTSQLARDQAFAYGHLAAAAAAALDVHVEFPDLDVPHFPVEADDAGGPEAAAREVRRAWGVTSGPFGHAVRALENHGVLVVFSPPTTAAVDAYSFEAREHPVVVLNPVKRDYYRQRFDVAHELGHLVMHSDAEPGGRVVEDQAHRFAAELLMPEADIRNALPTSLGRNVWPRLLALKEEWGVSMAALLYRARRLGALSDVSYRNAMMTMSTRGWRRDEPGAVTVIEQPSLLPAALELLEAAGVDRGVIVTQARVPIHLFDVITARTPRDLATETMAPAPASGSNVVSLLGVDATSELEPYGVGPQTRTDR